MERNDGACRKGRVWLRRRPDPGGSENGAARRRRLLPSRVAEVVAADDSVGEAPGLPQVLFRRAVNGRPHPFETRVDGRPRRIGAQQAASQPVPVVVVEPQQVEQRGVDVDLSHRVGAAHRCGGR